MKILPQKWTYPPQMFTSSTGVR